MPAAIPIVASAAIGAAGTYAPMAVGLAKLSWGLVAMNAAIGAAVGAMGVMLQPDRPGAGSSASGRLQTTSIRNRPVPVVFGTVRVPGNYLALGNFHKYKDADDDTPGVRLRQMNAVLGLCEGEVQRIEQILLDGKTIAKQIEEVELPERFKLFPVMGGPRQPLPAWLGDSALRKKYGFSTIADPVAWRNTAYLVCGVNVGAEARLADISAKVTGPDLSIDRSGMVADGDWDDVFAYCHYDGHTESFCGTLSSSTRTGPFGLLRAHREGQRAEMTLPPASVSANIARAWYLGRHDVLVMQDPSDASKFHIGCWGIERDSGDWETVHPDPGYSSPILLHHLDELHGLLHTLHSDGSQYYIMQWHLLTGRITRIQTDINTGEVRHFMYAPDHDAYLIGGRQSLDFVDRASGVTYHTTDQLRTWQAKGLCATGALVGAVYDSGVIYYDPKHRKLTKRYGSSDAGEQPGHFGGITLAVQNTWTGHVTTVKYPDGALFINFIPAFPDLVITHPTKSIPKTVTKLKRVAGAEAPVEVREVVYEEKEVEEKIQDLVGGVVRDWSLRALYTRPNESGHRYALRALQGNSSVAAAMWNAMVDEAGNDSGRWGAGLSGTLCSLSSFEAVHAYCVGPVLYPYKKINRYQERFKFDYLLDSERAVADFLANEVLLCINGYRTLIDGRLHVGVQRSALASVWHFTEHQINLDSQKLTFLGRPAGINQSRVEFPDAEDKYRRDFGEANDEYDQNVRGRVVPSTIAGNGITRIGHADALAHQIIDAVASNRRHITFKTSWIGFILSCGDGIEVTSESIGLSRAKFRITRIEEDENNEVQITAVEHLPVRDIVRTDDSRLDRDGTCAAIAESAEFRSGHTMTPMHMGVYEDPNRPRLLPLAALSPNTGKAISIRVDYRYDDDEGWTHLGSMDSAFGGMLYRAISTRSKSMTLACVHGDPDRKIDGDLPVVICQHEDIGEQHPRSGTGDEVAMAYHFDGRSNTLSVRRPNPQAWLSTVISPARVYRVHGVSEDNCYQKAMYLPLFNACTGSAANLYVQADAVPYLPFYLKYSGTVYSVPSEAGATDEPSAVIAYWSADSRFPIVVEMSVGGATSCGPTGTHRYEVTTQGQDWIWSDITGQSTWQLALVGTTDGSISHWEIRQSDKPNCRYKLTGSEGQCSPGGSWGSVTEVDASGCGGCSMASAYVTISVPS